jgi:hypothetical protein
VFFKENGRRHLAAKPISPCVKEFHAISEMTASKLLYFV